MRPSTTLLVLGVASVLGLGGGVGLHQYLPESPVARGLYIGAQRLPDDVSVASWLSHRQEEISRRTVVFVHGDKRMETTWADAGIEIDIHATVSEASQVGHRGGVVTRFKEAQAARNGQIDTPITYWVDEYKARKLLKTFEKDLRTEPVDARIDLDAREKHADVPGQELDVEASLKSLMEAEHSDGGDVDLITRPVPAAVTIDDLVKVDITKVVSTFDSTFRLWGSGRGRSANIREAARRLDGVVIPPGEVFSFNDRVGARTLERGFAYAPEIQGDELTTGVGGGTCQVSSTLHAAALYGGLEIVVRQSHSRPSSYTKLGLDATVSYPEVDLKIRNPLAFPVLIHAYLPDEERIRIDVLGGDPHVKVEYRYGINNIEEFERRITVKKHLPPGKRLRRQKGSRGMDITSMVTLRYNDGREEQRTYFSGYRPAPEVYWVAPGYDERELPPLPEHARGVEGRDEKKKGPPSDEELYAM